jgi:CrcB protein
MNLLQIFYIALGGALGALGRHGLAQLVDSAQPGKLPWGIFTVNLMGSIAIGILYVAISEKQLIHPDFRYLLVAGFLGAFTTYSTFSLDSFRLIEEGFYSLAAGYIFGTTALCLLGVWLGIFITRTLS